MKDYDFQPKKSRRRKNTDFNPNHNYVDSAMQEYLQKGGKITKLYVEKAEIDNIPSREAVDNFLLGKI